MAEPLEELLEFLRQYNPSITYSQEGEYTIIKSPTWGDCCLTTSEISNYYLTFLKMERLLIIL